MQTDRTTKKTSKQNHPAVKFCTNPECKRKGQLLPLSEFNKRKASSDGHQHRCRECAKEALSEYRETEQGKEVRARNQRAYRRRPNGRATDSRGSKKYRQSEKGKEKDAQRRKRDKHKVQVRSRLNHAVKSGLLPSPKSLACTRCGKKAEEYHHYAGYSLAKALDVIPLCKMCHAKTHSS